MLDRDAIVHVFQDKKVIVNTKSLNTYESHTTPISPDDGHYELAHLHHMRKAISSITLLVSLSRSCNGFRTVSSIAAGSTWFGILSYVNFHSPVSTRRFRASRGFFHSLIRVIHIVIRGGGNYENMGRGRRNIGRAGLQPSSPVLSFYFADPSLLLSISLKCHLEMREKLRTRYY